MSDGTFGTSEVKAKFRSGDFFAQSARFVRNLIVELRLEFSGQEQILQSKVDDFFDVASGQVLR